MAPEPDGRRLGEIAQQIGGKLIGDPEKAVTRPVPAGTSHPEGITFVGGRKYLDRMQDCQVAAVITNEELSGEFDCNVIVVQNPRAAFGAVLHLFARPMNLAQGVHSSASVSGDAVISDTVRVGANAVIEADAHLGEGVQIFPGSYIGQGVRIGAHTVIMPNVTIYPGVQIGERCLIHAGAVIGSDGFGFEWDGEKRVKIPHIGGVVIGSHVEIGANACIDRAPLEDTVIADGAKLDNLVQIGHGVQVGRHSVIASQSGLSGSVRLGERCMLGGQVGVADQLSIADDVVLGGKSAAFQNIDQAGIYFGVPARPVAENHRITAMLPKLPDLSRRVRRLERQIELNDESQDTEV